MIETRDRIMAFTTAHPGANVVYPTAVDGLVLIRGDGDLPPEKQFYDSALIIVVQGAKDLMLGDAQIRYSAGEYLALRVGLPVFVRISGVSAREPYLAVAMTIDLPMVHDLMHQIGDRYDVPSEPQLGLSVGVLTAAQADAVARIVSLLETPKSLRVLYPSIARELFYWLLMGPGGADIRRLATPDGQLQRIADAITFMRTNFTTNVPVERLAAIAHMSLSTFHHHFKAVTSMSPLQYQKQLRLLEARKLMLASGADVTRAAYHVGYESASQFSREYARMFGAPPRRDLAGVRAAAG